MINPVLLGLFLRAPLLSRRTEPYSSARLAWGNSGENMTTSSQERRWWTEEEDNILRQEGELQRAFANLIMAWDSPSLGALSFSSRDIRAAPRS